MARAQGCDWPHGWIPCFLPPLGYWTTNKSHFNERNLILSTKFWKPGTITSVQGTAGSHHLGCLVLLSQPHIIIYKRAYEALSQTAGEKQAMELEWKCFQEPQVMARSTNGYFKQTFFILSCVPKALLTCFSIAMFAPLWKKRKKEEKETAKKNN